MASFADISIRFGADLKQFSSQMQNAQRKLDTIGRKFQKVGAGLTLGVTTPLLALGAIAVKNFDVQAKAVAQVEQGLISTGNAVGYNTDQLKKMASALQENTLFGDENILKNVTAQLLTFTNVTGREFERTQQAALDLATRLDGDLKGATIQLGKALNDPVLGLSALSKSGIQFSKDQKILIKSLVEMGKTAEAQTLILDELEKQYGGSAAAAARAGLGPFTQLKNIIGDITEDFGEIILQGLNPIIDSVKQLALGFGDLSPETKKFLVIFGGIAAAVGPLLALAGTILPAIGTGFALLTGPIGLIVAGLTAVGIVIYKNWEPIKATLVELANYFVDLYNESAIFRGGVEAIVLNFRNLLAVGKFVFGTLGNAISAIGQNIKDSFGNLGDIVTAILTGDIASLASVLAKGFKDGFKVADDLLGNIGEDFKTLKGVIEKNIGDGINNTLRGKKYELLGSNVDTVSLTENVSDAIKAGLEAGVASANGGPFTPQTVALDIETKGIAKLGDTNVFANVLDTIQAEKMSDELLAFEERLLEFRENSNQILQGAVEDFAVGFGQILGGIISGTAGIGDIGALLLNSIGSIATQLGRAAIQIGITMKALKLSFSSPGAAIFAGIGLVALGALLKSVSSNFAGNFASGGIVGGSSFSGDNLVAGVNSGELILNLAQQKNLAGAFAKGNTIRLSPSLRYEAGGFRIMLNEENNRLNRST